jgi:molybdopterin molybdotransferase
VSVLVIFELFVVPAIDRIVGRNATNIFVPTKLLADFQRRDAGREQYYPVRTGTNGTLPLDFHGSAHMQALTRANGIMQIKAGIKKIKKGATVYVRPI